jgi:hypothetical protein
MLERVGRLQIEFAAGLDQCLEGEAQIAGRREEPRAAVAEEVGVIRDREIRFDV